MQNSLENYTTTDFVCDDIFLKHHLSPTSETQSFWSNWLHQYPEKEQEWLKAQHLLEAVRLGLSDYARTYLSPEAEAQLLSRIQQTNLSSDNSHEKPVVPLWPNKWIVTTMAACILLILGVLIWNNLSSKDSIYEHHLSTLQTTFTEKHNTTNKPLFVQLPDASVIILTPKSKISYTSDFGKEGRTVYLSGEATFDITKDPSKPFLVYANELVTKVLGTRFIVKAFDESKDVVVTVQQGKVSVYRNEIQARKVTTTPERQGVLLLPNQQVVFTRQTEQFNKSVIQAPILLKQDKNIVVNFEFDETPVIEVFETIRKAYGIDIVYNTEVLKNCQFTASLAEESLFQKLDVITQAINATYEVLDGQVIIVAKGCN